MAFLFFLWKAGWVYELVSKVRDVSWAQGQRFVTGSNCVSVMIEKARFSVFQDKAKKVCDEGLGGFLKKLLSCALGGVTCQVQKEAGHEIRGDGKAFVFQLEPLAALPFWLPSPISVLAFLPYHRG